MVKLFHFKKWIPVWEFYIDTFLGESIKYYWIRFLYCEETDEAKEFRSAGQGAYWEYLSKEEVKILKSKMKKNGNHYELKEVKNE